MYDATATILHEHALLCGPSSGLAAHVPLRPLIRCAFNITQFWSSITNIFYKERI